MTRSNRLLIAGGVLSLIGVGLVAVVLLGQPSAPTSSGTAATDVQAAADDETTATPVVQVVRDEDGNPVFTIPEGHEALALTVTFQRSVAGLPQVGDRVNVYGVFESFPNALADDLPAVRRVLADVPVLAVTGAAHRSNNGAPTIVVGLLPEDVEAAIYVHAAESIYLTLVHEDTEASPATEGANAGTLRP